MLDGNYFYINGIKTFLSSILTITFSGDECSITESNALSPGRGLGNYCEM